MDRNAILAVVLASIVLIVWTVFFAPPPPEFEAIPVDSTATAQQLPELDEPDAVAERPAAGVEEVPTQSFNDSTFALAQIGTAEAVTVETDLYQAVFSTKGGTLTSFILKEYDTFGHERPVQIVDTTGAGALSLVFTSLDSRLVDTRALYFEPSSRGPVLADDAERELTFTRALGSGALRYTYTFTPGSYEVGMRVEADGAASFMATDGYEFIWNGGVPFAEGGAKEEAMVSGAYVRSGGEVESVNLTSDPVESYRLGGSIEWIAVKNSFFTAVVLPSSDVGTRGAELEGERIGEDTDPNFWETYEARILVNRPAGDADTYRMYLGPVDYKQFSEYGVNLYDIVDYGFGSFVTRPIAKWIVMPSFNFLSSFIPNYGFVIIIFAILIKLILFPLTKSSYRSMAKMRTLQPKMAEIKEKYKNDPQKQQQATMKMYQESGVNPLGSCLPQLLQLPILFALFRFFPTSIDIRQEGFLWAQDLSAPDVVLNLPFSLPFYGDFVSGFTVLMFLSVILQMRIQQGKTQDDSPQAKQMKIIMYVMPVMILVFFNRFASGLSLYYLTYNLVTAVQQKLINNQLEAEGVDTGKNGKAGKNKAESNGNGRSSRSNGSSKKKTAKNRPAKKR